MARKRKRSMRGYLSLLFCFLKRARIEVHPAQLAGYNSNSFIRHGFRRFRYFSSSLFDVAAGAETEFFKETGAFLNPHFRAVATAGSDGFDLQLSFVVGFYWCAATALRFIERVLQGREDGDETLDFKRRSSVIGIAPASATFGMVNSSLPATNAVSRICSCEAENVEIFNEVEWALVRHAQLMYWPQLCRMDASCKWFFVTWQTVQVFEFVEKRHANSEWRRNVPWQLYFAAMRFAETIALSFVCAMYSFCAPGTSMWRVMASQISISGQWPSARRPKGAACRYIRKRCVENFRQAPRKCCSGVRWQNGTSCGFPYTPRAFSLRRWCRGRRFFSAPHTECDNSRSEPVKMMLRMSFFSEYRRGLKWCRDILRPRGKNRRTRGWATEGIAALRSRWGCSARCRLPCRRTAQHRCCPCRHTRWARLSSRSCFLLLKAG